MRLRRYEWILSGYFTYTSALALLLPLRMPIPRVTLVMNTIVLCGLALLVVVEPIRHRPVLRVLRDWYPLALLLLAYREMGWFAPAHHSFTLERAFEVWDKRLLNEWGLKAAIELTGPVLPSLLELGYAVVYAIPAFALITLYCCREDKRAPRLLFTVLFATLVAYALFPYFPSEPPRTVFPGQDFPAYSGALRRFNWWLLGGYGIHTSVFPSAHVSSAFASAFAMRRILPEHPWVGRSLLAMASLIAVATIYGRYHYAADAAAGFALAVAAHMIAARWERGNPSAFCR